MPDPPEPRPADPPEGPTPRQREALAELTEVAAASGGSLIVEAVAADAGWVTADLNLDAQPFIEAHRPGGLLFEPRETVRLHLPPTYPFGYPRVSVSHTRFAGYENLMRGGGICLFRSPDTEWDPALGLAGFIRYRLWSWFERTARGELEQQGGAFHAPVLHDVPPAPAFVVLREPEPPVAHPWLGFTKLWLREPPALRTTGPAFHRVDLVGWSERTDRLAPGQLLGAAVLLDHRLGFAFPSSLGDLLSALDQAGVSPTRMVEHLGKVARIAGRSAPLFFTVGTPIAAGGPNHYLTTMLIEATALAGLREAGGSVRKAEAVERAVREAPDRAVLVCYAHDARRGVVTRRDSTSPMGWFEGRAVSVWGCGALGGPIALALARAGVRRLVLRDRGLVSPGLLARQPFAADEVDVFKVDALRHRLLAIRPGLDVAVDPTDVLLLPADIDWTDGADLVVNATASAPVRTFLDLRRAAGGNAPPLLTIGVDGRAERALVRLLGGTAPGGVGDLERAAKLTACANGAAAHFASAFFPTPGVAPDAPFYPEPGCSESTFVGSAADMAALAGASLNWAAHTLSGLAPDGAVALLHAQPHVVLGEPDLPHLLVTPSPSIRMADERGGRAVVLDPRVPTQIETAIADARRRLGPDAETGGPLFGEWDPVREVVWIDHAGPPPPDSVETPGRFICGVEGLAEENDHLHQATRGTTGFIGTWHTHPRCPPDPSTRDLAGMADFFARPERLPRLFTMLIVGSPHGAPALRPHVFHRSEFNGAGEAAAASPDGPT